MAITDRIIDGLGSTMKELMGGRRSGISEDTEVPSKQKQAPGYPFDRDEADRIKYLGWKVYREGAFEKMQFARKWMRNALLFQGYQELDWSDADSSYTATMRDAGDFCFPNNYYRSHIMYGASLYVKNEPEFIVKPSSDDYEAQVVSECCQRALDVIKENVKYDALRVEEAQNLRLFGNSFRYSYYSLDARYGEVIAPIMGSTSVAVDTGAYSCSTCGAVGEGNPAVCPECGQVLDSSSLQPPTMVDVPKQTGEKKYPRGQEVTEVVPPLEVGMRTSAANLWRSPYLFRSRIVDRNALQVEVPNVDIGAGAVGGQVGSGQANDTALIYQQTLADMPGDPTQYAGWYDRATSFSRVMLLEVWLRPSQYAFDDELFKKYPDGIYAGIVGDVLLNSRNESLDDHWVHMSYIKVPGRIWGDGDDDLVPKQLQLNETERMIMRSQAYCSSPQVVLDAQRIDTAAFVNDPSQIIIAKTNGRPVGEAVYQMQGQAMTQETWQWRAAELADMDYHSGVFGSAIGQHQPGVNTYGGQEDMANRSEQTLSPLLLAYKEENEVWALQVLKLAAENWTDERVTAVQGINGNWEFKKLQADMMDLDLVQIQAKLIPIDYGQQQALAQAVATQLLDPLDPRVQRKALELYRLPADISQFSMDSKAQWREIERIKKGEEVMPVLLRDNDQVHAEICREWLNSDQCINGDPDIATAVYTHLQKHLINQSRAATIQGAMTTAPQEVEQMIMAALGGSPGGGEQAPPPPGGESPPEQPGAPNTGGGQSSPDQSSQSGESAAQQHPQAGSRGGQVPPSGNVRKRRAAKGAAAKPNRPQPPSGNQYHRQGF